MLAALTEAGKGHAQHHWCWRVGVGGLVLCWGVRNRPCLCWKDSWVHREGQADKHRAQDPLWELLVWRL